MPAREDISSTIRRSPAKAGHTWSAAHDSAALSGWRALRARTGGTGGVDARASRAHLYEVAKRLCVRGRSGMSKAELVEAIGRANDRETAKARPR
jgi:hypothetical protein